MDTLNKPGQYVITLCPDKMPDGAPCWTAAVPSFGDLMVFGRTPTLALTRLAIAWDEYERGCDVFGEPVPPELYMLVDKEGGAVPE